MKGSNGMHNDPNRRQFAAGALGALFLAACSAVPSQARAMDAAAQRINSYYASLLPAVAAARGLGVAERARRISSAIMSAFDIASMTRLAVGPAWSSFSGAERAQTIEAFGKFIVADYANQLGDYSGEGYKVDPNVEIRNGDQIVKTSLGSTEIDYLVRGSRILDIYANGTVSELATRRAEFASILAASGGAQGLTKELRQRTQQLLGS
jgi:phospholipid transport system substrate-binding protein